MRSKGSHFTLRVCGLTVCSLDVAFTSATVRNRPQPSATVRNRSQPFATVRVRAVWPCLWQVLQKGSSLDVSSIAAAFRLAGVALRDIQTCFVTCRKSFCVTAQYSYDVFTRCVKRSALDVSIIILRGKRGTLDLSCCVLWGIALSRLRQVGTRCKFHGRHDILCHVMKIDASLARNIDFEENVDFEATKCQNWRKCRTKCRFDAPTCLLSSLWFSCGLAVFIRGKPHSLLYTPHSTLYTLHSTL